MTPHLPNPRYERKFIAPGLTLTEVAAMLRRHPAFFIEAFPPRLVNNIYLDTPSLSDYTSHVHGRTRRVKTRIRWYGEVDGLVGAGALERKIKDGLQSGKAAYPLPAFEISRVLTRTGLQEVFAGAELPDALRLAVALMEPVLINQYRRCYFQSADRRFRITADAVLQSRPLNGAAGAAAAAVHRSRGVIIELKFAPHHAEDAAHVASALPFRLTRFSKYVAGIQGMAFG